MTKINEKNSSANLFEKAYIISLSKARLEGPDLTNIESEIGDIPAPVKEMINEIMKAKYNSDIEKITQEIKESKIQHDLVEELRKEIRSLHEKLGNVEQEKIILNSAISKIKDVDANVLICQKTVEKITQEIKESKIQHDLVEELRKEIRSLHEKLGNVEQENKTQIKIEKNQQMGHEKHFQKITQHQETGMKVDFNKIKPKKVKISLVLSIVFGLIGFSGISHMYLDKIPKGIGILLASFVLIGLAGYFLTIAVLQNPSNLQSILHSFGIIPLVGYFGIFGWQIFDSYKLCLKYNKHVTESGKLPPWW
jgi:hypothetical protein